MSRTYTHIIRHLIISENRKPVENSTGILLQSAGFSFLPKEQLRLALDTHEDVLVANGIAVADP